MSANDYVSYLVSDGESLETIAVEKLFDRDRWVEIAQLNGLRYPFISNRAADWYGPVVTAGILIEPLGIGRSELRLPGERKEMLSQSAIFFVDGYETNENDEQRYAYDAIPIASFDPVTGLVRLAQTVAHNWPTGTRYKVTPAAQDVSTQVARPGQRILLPIRSSQRDNILDSGQDITLFGTDIALLRETPITPRGRMRLYNGDLLTVSGASNMVQACWLHAALPYGSYVLQPDLGNRIFSLLGEKVQPETPYIAAGLLREALLRDPRIKDVQNVRLEFEFPDSIAVDALAILEDTEDAIDFNLNLQRG